MPATTKAGSIACRSAPTENISSGDQITRPLYSASARSTAAPSASATSGLMACIFEWMLAISTSPSSVHTRTSPSSLIVVPAVLASAAFAPSTLSGNSWRSCTGSLRCGTNLFCEALHEPSGVCTPPASATGPSNTHFGSGALLSALPASMSSCTHFATCDQPASCQSSNGPCFMPKPQRIAKSMSRALSAMSPRCTAA